MCLLEALSDAAAEITTKLQHSSVEVRLRGREAQFVVTEVEPPAEPVNEPTSAAATAPVAGPAAEEGGDIARLTLRLPEQLKEAVERTHGESQAFKLKNVVDVVRTLALIGVLPWSDSRDQRQLA